MNREHIHQYLRALGVHKQEISDGDDWVRCPCLLAPWTHDSGKDGHPSFGIKVRPNRESYFHCYSCESGDLVDLVYQLREHSNSAKKFDYKTALKIAEAEMSGDLVLGINELEELVPKGDVIFSEIWWESFTPALNAPRAYEYLRSRGLPDDVIHKLDIRFDQGKDAVVFPIRNAANRLAQVRGRFIAPKEGAPRYHVYKTGEQDFTRKIWMGEAWADADEPVVMVESVFDLASVFRVYKNLLAPLSVGISKDLAYRVSEFSEIFTLFDNGKGGDKARNKIDQYFPDASVTHLWPSDGCDDPGDMSQTQLHEVLPDHLLAT